MNSEKEPKGNVAQTFEELFIYQRARELTNAVYALSRSGAFAGDHNLADQIRRASVSIMSHVAEGFERGTSTEFIQFLYIAKGSCGEVRAQLQVACDQKYITAEAHTSLVDQARRVSGMISNFIAHLQKSNYRGEKFSRAAREAGEKAAKWLALGQAAQAANIRAQKSHNESLNSTLPGTGAATSSNPSDSSHLPPR